MLTLFLGLGMLGIGCSGRRTDRFFCPSGVGGCGAGLCRLVFVLAFALAFVARAMPFGVLDFALASALR